MCCVNVHNDGEYLKKKRRCFWRWQYKTRGRKFLKWVIFQVRIQPTLRMGDHTTTNTLMTMAMTMATTFSMIKTRRCKRWKSTRWLNDGNQHDGNFDDNSKHENGVGVGKRRVSERWKQELTTNEVITNYLTTCFWTLKQELTINEVRIKK